MVFTQFVPRTTYFVKFVVVNVAVQFPLSSAAVTILFVKESVITHFVMLKKLQYITFFVIS